MTQPSRSSVAAVIVTVLAGGWVVGVTVLLQGLGWGIDQLLLLLGVDNPWWSWVAVSLVNAVLVAVPAVPVAFVPRSAAVRAAGRAWLGGALAVGGLGCVRAVPSTEPELYLALLAIVAAALAALLGSARRGRPVADPYPGAVGFAAAAGLVVLLPWLWFGALGGALETLLAVAAAAALGWLAGAVLGFAAWPGLGERRVRSIVVGGLVAGVALLLVAAGTGASGAQLPLLVMLPPLGFAAAVMARWPHRWAVPAMIGLATLGPLALVDPEEVTLLLTGRDVPFWTSVAAVGSWGLALLVGLGYLLGSGRSWSRPVAAAVAGGLVVVGAVVHLGLGQPGLYGERLFVVLADQADLSALPADLAGATGQAGRDARAVEVYQRLVDHAETSQADLRAELDRLRLPYTPYYLVNAVEVAGGPEVRAWLSRRDDVDRVLRSQRLRPLPAPGATASGTAGLAPDNPGWNIAMIGADRAWEQGVTGEGIVVGGSDSGVDGRHPALADGFRGGDDSWSDPWRGTATPTDRNGHGTHTLGSAVGQGGIGVAPGAQWTACVNLDRNLGNPAVYLDCLQFMLAPFPPGGDPFRDGDPRRAPHVLTNSWGCPPIEGCDPSALRPATAALYAAGIYLVAAAGNTGPLCESIQDPPAPHPDVLTVGAVDRDERVTQFSSRGPVDGTPGKPDLVAPGDEVVSAMPGGGYAALSGTSMATPHLAGVVALMWSANGALIGDLATTTEILHQTARPLPPPGELTCGGFSALAGSGLVDAHAAVLSATDLATAAG